LKRGGVTNTLKEPTVMEFIVQDGAPFAGKEIRSLGLPAGCILVRCSDGKREWVPKANTRLQPHMRLTAFISPEAEDSLKALRHGCEARKKKD
jgi:CIC family chloride channel protein